MAVSISGSIITLTGTSNSLDVLLGVAGVTTLSIGSGSDGRTIYSIGNRQLRIDGTLNINPELEAVYAGTGSPRPVFRVNGTLNINGAIVENGVTRYSQRICMWSPYQSGAFQDNPGLEVRGSGTMNWIGGAIRVGSAVRFRSGATVLTEGATLFQDRNSDNQLRQETSNWTCNSFRFIGNDITFIAIPLLLSGYDPRGSRGALGFSTSTPNIDFPIAGFGGDASNDSDVRFWRGCRPIITGSARGTDLIATAHVSGNTSSYGVAIIRIPVRVSIIDASGIGISDARVFTRDTDNGNRETYNRESHTVDATPDHVYLEDTNASGQTAQYDITTGYNIVNNGNGDAPNTGNYAWDYRGNNNDSSDVFDFNVASYNHGLTTFSAVLKSTTTLDLSTTLFIDPLIVEPSKTIAASYTQQENAIKSYDQLKALLVDNYNGERDTTVVRQGGTLDCRGLNVVVDDGVGVATLSGNTLTLHAAEFEGNIITTGVVTLTGGATVQGVITDINGVRSTVEIEFNGIVPSSRLMIRATDSVGAVSNGDLIYNDIVNSDPFAIPFDFEGPLSIFYRIRKADAAPFYKTDENNAVISAAGFTGNITQILDE